MVKNFYLFKIITSILILMGIFSYFYYINNEKVIDIPSKDSFSKIFLNNKEYPILLASTSEELSLGLGNRTSLNEIGMLFSFDEERFHRIWMKDMHFPIDIIWLDEDFKIVELLEDISPDTYPKVFAPRASSWHVFEAKSGFVDEFNFEVGDTLNFLP